VTTRDLVSLFNNSIPTGPVQSRGTAESRVLARGFKDGTRADARWRKLAERKLAELGVIAEQIRGMELLLKRMQAKCHCKTLVV